MRSNIRSGTRGNRGGGRGGDVERHGIGPSKHIGDRPLLGR